MDDLVNIAAEIYADRFSFAGDKLRNQVEQDTIAHHAHSHMLSGHVQGNFLALLSCLLKPSRILEIGTFTGFSALCLAEGLLEGGELHTIELRETDAATARSYFSKSLHNNKIVLHEGNALDIIPTLKHAWDIVFIDADKVGYIDYYELTLPALKQNGLLIADNIFFHGKVLQDDTTDKNAIAMRKFNEHVAADQRVEQVLLTVRDGLSLIRKL